MTEFERRLIRIKEVLGVATDKDVASAIGMAVGTFSARKRRDSFPTKDLYVLAANRPDLEIDVNYVLTGIAREVSADLLIDQIDQAIAVHDRVVAGYAQLLRDNKIDWISASNQFSEQLRSMDAVVGALVMVLRLAGLDAECRAGLAKAAAAAGRNRSICADLRTNCLLNGPQRVPA